MTQLTMLLTEMDTAQNLDAEARHMELWRYCWNWDGPTPGGYCEIDNCVVNRADGGTIYAYMERCRLIEKQSTGLWIAEIAMGVRDWKGNGQPYQWEKDGTRVLLSILDIWPPTRDLNQLT